MREEGSLRENRAELRARFERLLVAIRAEPFDRGAIEAILDEQRAAGARRLELAEEAVLDRLSAMTPEARAAYADRLDRSLAPGAVIRRRGGRARPGSALRPWRREAPGRRGR